MQYYLDKFVKVFFYRGTLINTDIINVLMFVATIIILTNLNGIFNLIFGVSAPFSPLILPCVLLPTFFFMVTGVKFHILCTMYVVSLLCYLIMSGISLIGHIQEHDPELLEDNTYLKNTRLYLVSILTVFSFYVYTRYKIKKNQLLPFIEFCTILFLATTALTPLAEVLGLNDVYEFGIVTDTYDRKTGAFKNPNSAGSHANLTLVFVLFMLTITKGWKSVLYLVLVPIPVIASIATYSKASLIMSVLVFFIFIFFVLFRKVIALNVKSNINRITRITMIVMIAAVVYAPFYLISKFEELSHPQQQRIMQTIRLVSGEINEETTSHRSRVYAEGIYLIKKHPLIGFGFAGLHRLPVAGFGVHNSYLAMIGEAGIFVGILFLIWLLLSLYYAVFNRYPFQLKFFCFGVLCVLFIQVYFPTAAGFGDRVGTLVLGIIFGILSFKRDVYEKVD
ncbi:MAG: O-antigen ligase family protein [Bacteroidota bacterium]